MKKIVYKPIGIIHSPFKNIEGVPIQSIGAKGISGTVELFKEYCKGLKDLEGFSYIILIYHFHLSKDFSLIVKPFMDHKLHGVFSTRAPKRPNSIGFSIVKLLKIKKCILYIEDVDIVDGTPLLDIKPYIPKIDTRNEARIGWLETNVKKVFNKKSDNRFK